MVLFRRKIGIQAVGIKRQCGRFGALVGRGLVRFSALCDAEKWLGVCAFSFASFLFAEKEKKRKTEIFIFIDRIFIFWFFI